MTLEQKTPPSSGVFQHLGGVFQHLEGNDVAQALRFLGKCQHLPDSTCQGVITLCSKAAQMASSPKVSEAVQRLLGRNDFSAYLRKEGFLAHCHKLTANSPASRSAVEVRMGQLLLEDLETNIHLRPLVFPPLVGEVAQLLGEHSGISVLQESVSVGCWIDQLAEDVEQNGVSSTRWVQFEPEIKGKKQQVDEQIRQLQFLREQHMASISSTASSTASISVWRGISQLQDSVLNAIQVKLGSAWSVADKAVKKLQNKQQAERQKQELQQASKWVTSLRELLVVTSERSSETFRMAYPTEEGLNDLMQRARQVVQNQSNPETRLEEASKAMEEARRAAKAFCEEAGRTKAARAKLASIGLTSASILPSWKQAASSTGCRS